MTGEPREPTVRPPRLARWLLSRIVPAGASRDGLLGDLDELYLERRESEGRLWAGLWYWREALGAAARYSIEGVRQADRRPKDRPGSRAGLLDALIQDLRFAFRSLRRSPGFALTAVCTLAIGTGGTTAIFTVVDTVLLRPPLWEQPGRLVNVWTTYPHWRGRESLDAYWDRIQLSFPEYEDWRSTVRSFRATAAYTQFTTTMTGRGVAERLTSGVGTASLLDVLGVHPALGRWFLPGEDVTGRRLVVLSDGFWKRRFGADRSVLGARLVLDDEPFTVIGVLPPGFALKDVFGRGGAGDHDVWLPIAQAGGLTERGNHSLDVIGRLADGVSVEAALAESAPILRGDAPPERRGVRMALREEVEVGGLRGPLVLLLAASGVLLLIACSNVATMLLGESLGRRPELATRAALGAGRSRMARQLLTESVVLGLAGAAAGALTSIALTALLTRFGPALPVVRRVAFRPRVLAFAGGLGVLTGLVFGFAPLFSLRRLGLRAAMQRGVGGSRRRDRLLQEAVIVFEIGLTMILLVGGGLLARTVINLFAVDPGFGTDRIAVVDASAATPRFTPDRVARAYAEALRNIGAVPGIRRVAGVSRLPLDGRLNSRSLEIEGIPAPSGGGPGPEAQRRVVFPGYHDVMGIPLLEGRLLNQGDGADAPLAMLISERFARLYWQDRSPLGARIRYDRRWWTVVGIVGDVRHGSLDETPIATYYVPFAQSQTREMTLVASTAADPLLLLPELRDAVQRADPDIAITGVHTMASLVMTAAADERYRAILIGVFAMTAMLLAAIGVFGVTARTVARRAPEMGVRLALGARVQRLTAGVVGTASLTVLAGLTLGTLGAFWASRLLAGFLFGIRPSDPLTFLAVASTVLGAAILSSWLAARRIARVDPAEVLRAQ